MEVLFHFGKHGGSHHPFALEFHHHRHAVDPLSTIFLPVLVQGYQTLVFLGHENELVGRPVDFRVGMTKKIGCRVYKFFGENFHLESAVFKRLRFKFPPDDLFLCCRSGLATSCHFSVMTTEVYHLLSSLVYLLANTSRCKRSAGQFFILPSFLGQPESLPGPGEPCSQR